MLICLSIFSLHQYESAIINCQYELWKHEIMGDIYYCLIQNSAFLNSQETAFMDLSGNHTNSCINSHVKEIWFDQGVISYFPTGLDSLHKDFELIYMGGVQLQEINQSDLKPFKKLVTLYLPSNNLEIIDDGLFDFNPKLKYIDLRNNKIRYIYPGVFANVKNLLFLALNGNVCINKTAKQSRAAVQDLMKKIDSECRVDDIFHPHQTIEELYSDTRNYTTHEFYKRIRIFEYELKFSLFLNNPVTIKKIKLLKDMLVRKEFIESLNQIKIQH